ncbi:Por secretion system C-terminal sorting domain-containing protein [Cyclonatronum proteinivorum]|uniref:Por secretion system C-terminal sorting domain-containing protein n=1 Tax=Cyclonatronum proteinivorum TaxID=1457365 RepID=A0A345UKJ0_9BACT|nr:T9SS type A sorting domain-containing protein [Cyclonatronum proteinivorum]AXJ00992.1 Por secretion system C-terminal sorting domain-containing protein [Cyclonatronum proteinivorum]
MKPTATFFSSLFLIFLLMCTATLQLEARQAAQLFPADSEAAFASEWRVIVTNLDDEVIADSLFSSIETVGFEGDLANETLTYQITPYPPVPERLIKAEGNRVFARLSDLIDLGALDEFGLPISFDAEVDLINFELDPGTVVQLVDETLRFEVPEEIGDLIDLPDGISLGDSLDIGIGLTYERLEARTFDNSLGVFSAEGGQLLLSVDVTLSIIVPIFGPQPITIPILEDFGPEFYMAEGLGLVYEELPPTEIAIRLDLPPFAEINQPIAEIDGSVYEKQSLTPLGTQLGPQDEREMASLISLYPNYPNPFNPTTNLVFSLHESAQLRIAVYDVQGRQVAVAADGHFGQGTHHLPFNAAALASGLYTYRITATGNQSGAQSITSGRFTVLK